VDLSASANIGRVVINWWTNYAVAYQIQSPAMPSTDACLHHQHGDGQQMTLPFLPAAAIVRMFGTVRSNTGHSGRYSIYEMSVYGTQAHAHHFPLTITPVPHPHPASSAILFDDFKHQQQRPEPDGDDWTLRNVQMKVLALRVQLVTQ